MLSCIDLWRPDSNSGNALILANLARKGGYIRGHGHCYSYHSKSRKYLNNHTYKRRLNRARTNHLLPHMYLSTLRIRMLYVTEWEEKRGIVFIDVLRMFLASGSWSSGIDTARVERRCIKGDLRYVGEVFEAYYGPWRVDIMEVLWI